MKSEVAAVTTLDARNVRVEQAAEKFGCQHAVILGGDEVTNQCVKVKNLAKRQEEQVSFADLDTFQFV